MAEVVLDAGRCGGPNANCPFLCHECDTSMGDLQEDLRCRYGWTRLDASGDFCRDDQTGQQVLRDADCPLGPDAVSFEIPLKTEKPE